LAGGEHRRSGEPARWLIPIALASGSLLLSLYAAELVCRVLFVEPVRIARYYPFGREIFGGHLTLAQREFAVSYDFNRFGFRDAEFVAEKNAGERRILFVGDSFVEGQGVEVAQRFSTLVAQQLALDAGGPETTYRAVNLGQLATQPIDYLHNLAGFGLALHPDFVVVGFFVGNDFMGGRKVRLPVRVTVGKGFARPAPDLVGQLAEIATLHHLRGLIAQLGSDAQPHRFTRRIDSGDFWAVYHGKPAIDRAELSAIFQVDEAEFDRCTRGVEPDLVEDTIAGRINPAFLAEVVHQNCPRADAEPDADFYTEDDVLHTFAVLAETERLLTERAVPHVFVIIPAIDEVVPDVYAAVLRRFGWTSAPPRLVQLPAIRAELLDFLERDGFRYIDVGAALRKLPDGGFYPIDTHLNPAGHRAVAQELVRYLRERLERGRR
jgi:hypothetical protein